MWFHTIHAEQIYVAWFLRVLIQIPAVCTHFYYLLSLNATWGCFPGGMKFHKWHFQSKMCAKKRKRKNVPCCIHRVFEDSLTCSCRLCTQRPPITLKKCLAQKSVKLVNITFHPHVILIPTVSATGQELMCPEGMAQELIMMDYDRFLLDWPLQPLTHLHTPAHVYTHKFRTADECSRTHA